MRRPACLLPHAMPSRDHYGDVLQLHADLWRVPFTMCLGAVAFFLVTVLIDREASRGALYLPGWLSVGGPDDARAILGAMLGGVSTVLALIFSVALLVLSMAVTNFGPRILYRFVSDGVTQATIGLFLASFVHTFLAFVVTRQQGNRIFVPQLTLMCGVALVMASFIVLVIFSHRIAMSIQTQNVVAHIVADLDWALAQMAAGAKRITLIPPTPAAQAERDAFVARQDAEGGIVRASRTGFIQEVRMQALLGGGAARRGCAPAPSSRPVRHGRRRARPGASRHARRGLRPRRRAGCAYRPAADAQAGSRVRHRPAGGDRIARTEPRHQRHLHGADLRRLAGRRASSLRPGDPGHGRLLRGQRVYQARVAAPEAGAPDGQRVQSDSPGCHRQPGRQHPAPSGLRSPCRAGGGPSLPRSPAAAGRSRLGGCVRRGAGQVGPGRRREDLPSRLRHARAPLMEKLLRGVSVFIRRRRPGLRATFKRLAQGQNPIALLLACSDSRVVPSLLLSADPGDIFEVRTVGNIIAPADAAGETAMGDESEAAAIEYALIALNVKHIVVMGHSSCGAMAKVLSGHPLEGAPNLERWLVHARKASDRLTAAAFIDRALSPGDQLSQANVLQQLEHVRSYALVAGQVAQGDLELHRAWFDIERADLHIWSAKKSRFIRMDEAVIARALHRRAESVG